MLSCSWQISDNQLTTDQINGVLLILIKQNTVKTIKYLDRNFGAYKF